MEFTKEEYYQAIRERDNAVKEIEIVLEALASSSDRIIELEKEVAGMTPRETNIGVPDGSIYSTHSDSEYEELEDEIHKKDNRIEELEDSLKDIKDMAHRIL